MSRYTAAGRAALKRAITSHPEWPVKRAAWGASGALTIAELERVARELGIDPRTYAEGPAAPQAPARPARLETVDGQGQDPVQAARALLAPLAGSPVADAIAQALDHAEARIAALEARASQAALTGGTVPAAGPAPIVQAKCLGRKPAASVFAPDVVGTTPLDTLEVVCYQPGPLTPVVDNDYCLDFDLLADMLAVGGNIWLGGHRGTGKSTLAREFAARTGRPFFRIGFSGGLEGAELIGMTVPSAAGGVVWRDGILTHAIRHQGAVILLDEPSTARPGVVAALHGVLEWPTGRLDIAETGETVTVAADVLFFAADNTMGSGDETGAYAGTMSQSVALLDRFSAKEIITYLPADKEAKVLRHRSGAPAALCNELVRVAGYSRAEAATGALTIPIGLRALVACARMLAAGRPVLRSWEVTVIRGAPAEDQEALQAITAAHLDVALLASLARGKAPVTPTKGTQQTDRGRQAAQEFSDLI